MRMLGNLSCHILSTAATATEQRPAWQSYCASLLSLPLSSRVIAQSGQLGQITHNKKFKTL